MPLPEKLHHIQTFEEGMNSAFARELVKPNQARFVLNCHIRSSAGGNVGIVTNVKGNELISTPLPVGINKCIGTASSQKNNKFYFFVWNSLRFDSIFQYDEITNTVVKVLENLTDTGNLDITNFDPDYLILHADIVRNNLLYWVDGLNPARKTNINKLFDKSDSGYGGTVLQSFIDAYKITAPYAPTAIYITDTTKPFNRLYRQLTKYAVRYIYDDGEKSCVSDFSGVVLPDKEPITGIKTIPTNNNAINITFETGSRQVVRIEVLMQSTAASVDEIDGLLNWVLIATVNKKKLRLSDNSSYTYTFYNDLNNYPVVAPSDVFQPYSDMLKRPRCQAIAKQAITYTNGFLGAPVVNIDASISVTYQDLFIDDGTLPELNNPQFTIVNGGVTYTNEKVVTRYDGTQEKIGSIIQNNGPVRFAKKTLTIGHDVKKGNKFQLFFSNGFPGDNFEISYEALITDSAITVVNELKQRLIATQRIYKQADGSSGGEFGDIYVNSEDGDGNITFSFLFKASKNQNYVTGTTFVNQVNSDTLKDTGDSVRNEKMGSTRKYGIVYEDFDGRKSLTYTIDDLVLGIQPYNVDGIKASLITLTIYHLAPKWAKYYQIVRTDNLNSSDFLDVLIQNVVEVPTVNTNNYLDLVIGSYFTYKKLHPNSVLDYQFEPGDRISLKKKTSDDTRYPFFETEIIEYNPIVQDKISSSLVTNGTATVTVAQASDQNIGKFILIEGSEREILDAPTTTTYLLNNVIGDATTPKTYNYYELVDRRGTIRIAKPDPAIVVIEDLSVIQIYKPSKTSTTDKTFFEFQKKFPIINPGTDFAYHSGNKLDQTGLFAAEVEISGGTTYVRNREMPTNNIFPGTQVVIELVEDPSFSDFYKSQINDNGRINSEDTGQGEIHFGSVTQFSNVSIENTAIHGFNDFRNLNREDYTDLYGDIVLTVFEKNRINAFKQLVSAWIPIDAVMTKDTGGNALLVSSNKFLNPIQYYAWEGGIGNNPESYASNGTHRYYVSCNSGVIIRFGGNGEEPISKTYFVDNTVRTLLANADRNGAKIYGSFDRENDYYVIHIEAYHIYIFNDGLTSWITKSPPVGEDVIFEVVDLPLHGTLTFTNPTQWTYQSTGDYEGTDSYSYRAYISGEWTPPEKVCIMIARRQNLTTGWRAKASSGVCIKVGTHNIGYIAYSTLEEFYLEDGTLTGNEKPNSSGGADYVPIQYNPTLCPLPVFVTVNYSNLVDLDPYVWVGLILERNGIEVRNITDAETGSTDTLFARGDTVKVKQFSLPASFLWPPLSNANLTIDQNAVEIYNDDVIVQAATLQEYTFVIANDATVIDILSAGTSTAVGYKTYQLDVETEFPSGDFKIEIKDNTGAVLALSVEDKNGLVPYNFNVLDDVALCTVTIYNQSVSTTMISQVDGISGYTDTTPILAGTNLVLNNVPKGDINISLT